MSRVQDTPDITTYLTMIQAAILGSHDYQTYYLHSQVLGDWLQDSGRTCGLVQANIASTGTADSFIKDK